ncbi:hypothetical protein AX16_005957 [Volvariella volvacea WC 439]|nr:hypothetical protein AX16_005957 [Volvariella volvacea WC 439]
MKFSAPLSLALAALASQAAAHYTLPSLIINGQVTPQWANVRRTNNYNSQAPVTDVRSADFRCYTSETRATASTITVSAGSQIGVVANGNMYHAGVINVYMARATNGNAATFNGDGNVWFKVHQIPAVTNGGSSISWPGSNIDRFTFTLPRSLPTGEYLIRTEQIALHSASGFAGAQFYIACGQLNVINGGSGNPGPLVSIPGVYTGNEPGILINIYWPIPANYTQPGPPVWRG